MSNPYEELLGGELHLRLAPGERHERICVLLLEALIAGVANHRSVRAQFLRSHFQLNVNNAIRPDISVITTANKRLWLAVEVVSSDDHSTDTFLKKQIYEDIKVPRLWMVDMRYDNVEVYHATEHGLVLKGILAGDEVLDEPLLPEFQITIRDLFAA